MSRSGDICQPLFRESARVFPRRVIRSDFVVLNCGLTVELIPRAFDFRSKGFFRANISSASFSSIRLSAEITIIICNKNLRNTVSFCQPFRKIYRFFIHRALYFFQRVFPPVNSIFCLKIHKFYNHRRFLGPTHDTQGMTRLQVVIRYIKSQNIVE